MLSRHGCADQAAKLDPPVPPAEFPLMRQSSDLLWALWEHDDIVEPAHKSNINFFTSLSIENEETLGILKRALDFVPTKLSRIGYEFDVDSEAGKAILGKR